MDTSIMRGVHQIGVGDEEKQIKDRKDFHRKRGNEGSKESNCNLCITSPRVELTRFAAEYFSQRIIGVRYKWWRLQFIHGYVPDN